MDEATLKRNIRDENLFINMWSVDSFALDTLFYRHK